MLPNTNHLAEPWHSFYDELDSCLHEIIELHCCGGFVVTQLYGFQRPTADVDFLAVIPVKNEIIKLAGEDSVLCQKYNVHLHFVAIATYPENYQDRLIEMLPGTWENIKLCALEAHDLALTKLERNIDRDRDDVEYLAKTGQLDPDVLKHRYQEEFRPNLLAHEIRCDTNLQVWLESYWPG